MKSDCPLEDSPLVHYVNGMIVDTVRDGAESKTVRSSDNLPFPFEHIVNRFKVMTGLLPQVYSDPTDGQFKVRALGLDCDFTVHFEDCATDPWLQMVLIRREKKYPGSQKVEVLEPPATA